MIYLRLESSVCNVIVSLIGRMTGGANDLHVIICYKPVGMDYMRRLQSDIQNKTSLNNVTYFNHNNKPPFLLSPPPPLSLQ